MTTKPTCETCQAFRLNASELQQRQCMPGHEDYSGVCHLKQATIKKDAKSFCMQHIPIEAVVEKGENTDD